MTGGGRAQLLAIAPVFPPALAALEQEFTVHRRWLADDPAALLREISPQVRGLVTTGLRGFGPDDIAPLDRKSVV